MGGGAARAVLVADDDDLLLGLMARVLRAAGFEVIAAADGDAALRVFGEQAERIGAVVLDLAMPPRGAADALRAMLARSPELGVVFTSGGRLDADERGLLEAHGGRFLTKPFSPDALVRALVEVLGRKGPAAGGEANRT
jgi:two-component system OmpR family response regulator